MHLLTAIPVYNEDEYLQPVLAEVLRYADDVLVVDDGSTDRTAELLRTFPTVKTIRHPHNLGYGAGLRTAFREAISGGFDGVVTLDCDGQHEPSRIPVLAERLADADIVSGSRYLQVFDPSQTPPEQRRRINVEVTRWLNECLGLGVTDAFCGFKAYRTSALQKFDITDDGYAMPLQVWVQAAAHGMKIVEVAVPLIYLDESRAFGGALDDAEYRLAHYRRVFQEALDRAGILMAGGVSGMTAHRLRAPATDGGLLAEPPLATAAHEAVANADRLAAWDYDFQGRRAPRLRAQIHREIVDLARGFLGRHGFGAGPNGPDLSPGVDPPLIVTGHQPELFHPGVWIKNFAASAVAGSCGGLALNLIVDNDIPKSASIRVPRIQGGRLGAVAVDFDRWQGEIPYEDWKVRDESMFATFGDRARAALAGAVADPLLDDYWPRALRRRGEADTVGLRFALARRELEESWGVSNLELPLGAVCQSEGFLWFASHLIAQLPRYQEVHNTCLAEYRAAHRIRSRHHPVAALARQGDWLEAPFWVWRARQPRRRALLARQRARVVELRIDGEDEVLIELPLTPDGEGCCAVERLRDLPARSIRLRTRALTTTMFSRFLLGDLFIHGIGGAKYDELGNEIARRFFNFEPPGFLTLSLTLWLGLPGEPATAAELAAVQRRLRDLTFNPDRYLDEPALEEVRILINGRREAIDRPVTSRRERIARGMAIRRYNDALQPWVETLRAEFGRRKTRLLAGLRSNRIANNREFAFVLHSKQRLLRSLSGLILPP